MQIVFLFLREIKNKNVINTQHKLYSLVFRISKVILTNLTINILIVIDVKLYCLFAYFEEQLKSAFKVI